MAAEEGMDRLLTAGGSPMLQGAAGHGRIGFVVLGALVALASLATPR